MKPLSTTIRTLAAAGTVAALAACSASGTTMLPGQRTPPAISQVATSARGRERVVLRIRVPRRRHVRGSRYLSPQTQSATLSFTGPTPVLAVVSLTITDPRCKPAIGGTECTLPFTLEPGSYHADVSTYDQLPAGGEIPPTAKLLSTAKNVPFTVRSGVANQIGLILDGVPATLSIAAPAGTAGTAYAAPTAVSVTAKDADGFTIVGTYANPVTLTDSDTSGATTLATSGSDHPAAHELLSSTDATTLNYTGLAIAPVTLSAAATGVTTAAATFAPALSPIVYSGQTVNGTNEIVMSRGKLDGQQAFTASEIGWTNAPYNKSLSSSAGAGCSSIASVTANTTSSYTAALVSSPANGSCTYALRDGAGQTVSVTLAVGFNFYVADFLNKRVEEVAPNSAMATIGSGFQQPTGVAVDAKGNVYVADQAGQVYVDWPNGIQETYGSGYNSPRSVAADAAGNVYVADTGNNDVVKIAPNGAMSCVPSTVTLANCATGSPFAEPGGVAADANGHVYVADFGYQAVYEVYPDGSMGCVPSTLPLPCTISGTDPQGVAVDASGNVYVAEGDENEILEYAPDGTPMCVPNTVTVANCLTPGWNGATGIAVDSFENLYVADTHNDAVQEVPFGGGISQIYGLGYGYNYPSGVAVEAAGNANLAKPRIRGAAQRTRGHERCTAIGVGAQRPRQESTVLQRESSSGCTR